MIFESKVKKERLCIFSDSYDLVWKSEKRKPGRYTIIECGLLLSILNYLDDIFRTAISPYKVVCIQSMF